MAKIFQLELFIKEMSIWTLPHGSEDHDETIVEVTVFDQQNVQINGYVFGKNSTMNRGQNFLFTLSAMPVDDNKVFFNVFKKAYHRDKKFLGNGNIPIDKIFGDLFAQVFQNAHPTKTPQDAFQSNLQSVNSPIVGSLQKFQAAKQTPSQPPQANANAASKTNPPAAKQSLPQTKSNGNQKRPQDPNQTATAKQNPPPTGANATQDPKDPNRGDVNVAATNDAQDANQSQDAAIPAIKNLKTVNIAGKTASN